MHQNRLQRVRQHMAAQGFTQILVTSTPSVYYLTDLWVSPMERLLALYIPLEGPCKLFGNEMFALPPQQDLELVLHSDTQAPTAQLAKTVAAGKLGIDKFWPSKFLINLLEQRPDVQPILGSAPVDLARMCKDEKEIEQLVYASQINDKVMTLAIASIEAGMTERQLAARVEQLYQQHGVARCEGALVCFGPNGADPHHGPDDTPIAPGDSVVMDLFTPVGRYWCDMTRTVFFGSADEEQRRVYETVKAANLAAEAMIRPGIPMCQVDAAARQVIEQAGYGPYFTHRLGHGLGLECHEPPDNSSVDETMIAPGMVFSVEPGIYLPGKLGVRIEDLVLVTQDGCQVLNALSKDLLIV